MKKILIVQNKILHYRKPVYNLLSNNYDLTVIHSGFKSVLQSDKYREIICPVKRIGKFYLQSGVINQVRNGGYDVVIVMFDLWWLANIFTVLFKKNSRIVCWGHRYGNNLVVNFLRDVLMRLSHGVILYSDYDVKRMMRRGISSSKIHVAHNTMSVGNQSDGSQCHKDSFIYVGRAQKRKALNKLIVAFSQALTEIPDYVKIKIVGSGSENEKLKVLANKCGVSHRVIFYGEIIDDNTLKPLIQSAYAYVSPGHVGLGVLHSFAYGVPVVTERNAKHAQEFDNLKENENCILFNDTEELKNILITLCNEDDITQRLGRNAYKLYSEERTIEKMVQGFHSAIEYVL